MRCWPSTIEGLRATEADLLVEVTASPSTDGEPGLAHMREALERSIPVVTSNKWPVALHGVELARLARSRGVAFRAESTVMSGTPLLSALVDGLAGAVPIALRGLLNATANFILSRMAEGTPYQDALAEAQRAGLAERDAAADVEGYDAVAKVMILSALVFGRQLRREQVACRGITNIARSEIAQAASGRARLKHVATLDFSEPDGAGDVSARVEPELVPAAIRWRASRGPPTPWCAAQVRSERSRSLDPAPDRSLPDRVYSATSSPSRDRVQQPDRAPEAVVNARFCLAASRTCSATGPWSEQPDCAQLTTGGRLPEQASLNLVPFYPPSRQPAGVGGPPPGACRFPGL